MADIVQSISINAAKDVIFPLVSSAHGFQHWWAADVTEDEDTEIVELGFFNRGTIYRLKPVKNSTPWTAEWFCESGQEWAGTTLLFANNPLYRGETIGSYALVTNAILSYQPPK